MTVRPLTTIFYHISPGPVFYNVAYNVSWFVSSQTRRAREAPPSLAAKWIAGIDFGTVRIGIALADPEVKIASAYENYTRRNWRPTPNTFAAWHGAVARAIRRRVAGPSRWAGKPEIARGPQFGAWLAESHFVAGRVFRRTVYLLRGRTALACRRPDAKETSGNGSTNWRHRSC